MNLPKAIEIAQLNLNLATKRMPPDVKDALSLLIEAAKRIQRIRSWDTYDHKLLLPGESEE